MLEIHCKESVRGYFTKGHTYAAEWTTEISNLDKLVLSATDNRGLPHIVAEYTVHDSWFKQRFEVVKEVK